MPRNAAALFASLFAVAALAGCVGGDDETPVPESMLDGDATAADGNGADAGEDAEIEYELVETPVMLAGESPSGLWACVLRPVIDGCEITTLGSETYEFDVEYPGRLIGWELVLTSEPATPENPGMLFNSEVGEDEETVWHSTSGPSPVTYTMSDLDVPEGAPLEFSSWTMPDADVNGDLWIDPVSQPFEIEGVLFSLVEA